MAIIYGGVLWKGDTGNPPSHEVVSRIIKRTGGSVMVDTFVTSMVPHTLCVWTQKIYGTNIGRSIAAPDVGADVTKKAVIYFRDPDTLEVLFFSYPSPVSADIEVVSAGKRIKLSVVTAITGYLSTLADTVYIPLYGAYLERP